jgi:hypothetical protein
MLLEVLTKDLHVLNCGFSFPINIFLDLADYYFSFHISAM